MSRYDPARPFAALDFETTGTDPHRARPVSVSLVFVMKDGSLVYPDFAVTELVNCGVEVPIDATMVHGISTERVRAFGKPVAEVIERVIGSLGWAAALGFPCVIMNAKYDWTLLHAEAERYGLMVSPMPLLDPLTIDRQIDRYRKGKRTLTALASVYGVRLVDAHDATADCIGAAQVAHAMIGSIHRLRSMSFAQLHQEQIGWHREWWDQFALYLERKGGKHPSDTKALRRQEWPLVPAPVEERQEATG